MLKSVSSPDRVISTKVKREGKQLAFHKEFPSTVIQYFGPKKYVFCPWQERGCEVWCNLQRLSMCEVVPATGCMGIYSQYFYPLLLSLSLWLTQLQFMCVVRSQPCSWISTCPGCSCPPPLLSNCVALGSLISLAKSVCSSIKWRQQYSVSS